MPQPTQAQSSNQEGRIILAIKALKEGNIKSIRAAAMSYDVLFELLRTRLNGVTSRRDSTPNSRKLTLYEESALVQYILNLDSRGFPPRLQAVQEMADLLLSKQGESPVGKNWATSFITRRTEIKSKFSRKYDHVDFHPGCKLYKKWQTFYSPNEARVLLGRTRLQAL
ncbi:hypothetical protein V500_00241 [Pseudogymnoascus sp. VKM F-4518 (FW-2643)]|nr:hypothetical protein V500_00241 [Pseudogymnoascus sp. VKM F-4518 (FW-2643)]